MKEKIKKNKIVIFSIIVIIFIIPYFLFILDIGINSKYFIRKDFNNAFLSRKTGNCSVFKKYIIRDVEKWGERCIKEKDREYPLIKLFSIKEITINKNLAFLQTELERDSESYLVTYNMQRTNKDKFLFIFPKTKWMIINEFR